MKKNIVPLAAQLASSQVAAAAAAMPASAPKQTESMASLLDRIAGNAGKTTILQFNEGGGTLVWVTDKEVDPVTALMSAALSIMTRRGEDLSAKNGISIKRMAVQANGCDYYWQVTDNDGGLVANGYAKTEADAAEQITKHIMMPRSEGNPLGAAAT